MREGSKALPENENENESRKREQERAAVRRRSRGAAAVCDCVREGEVSGDRRSLDRQGSAGQHERVN